MTCEGKPLSLSTAEVMLGGINGLAGVRDESNCGAEMDGEVSPSFSSQQRHCPILAGRRELPLRKEAAGT